MNFEPCQLLINENVPGSLDVAWIRQRRSIQVTLAGNPIVLIGQGRPAIAAEGPPHVGRRLEIAGITLREFECQPRDRNLCYDRR